MPTPTNSVFNRGVTEEARISQLIYDNESLKIEVETLKEQLESTGALDIERLRADNETLRIDNERLKVQLEEKTAQLDLTRNSDLRFSNIDDSLKQLLEQIQSQREELADLKVAGKAKDDKIIALTVQMQKEEEKAVQAREAAQTLAQEASNDAAKSAEDARGLRAEVDGLRAQLAALQSEKAALAAQLAARDDRVRECEEELLGMKQEAAARSAVRGDRATEQERQVAAADARVAATQERVVALEASLAQLRETCTQAQQERDVAVAEATRAKAQLAAAPPPPPQRPAAASSAAFDPYTPEAKAYLKKKIDEAVSDRDRRLAEQVDQNAALLSRMAMIQHESDAMVKKAGLTGREVTAMNERVEAMSAVRGARTTMKRRVADFLLAETFSKEDVEMLLQEMLDHQERTEGEISTRLLIKDLQAEEAEKTFRWNLKRMENENTSLLKQLQKAAFASLQRHDRSTGAEHPSTNGNNNNNNADRRSPPSPAAAAVLPAAQTPRQSRTAGMEAVSRQQQAHHYDPHHPQQQQHQQQRYAPSPSVPTQYSAPTAQPTVPNNNSSNYNNNPANMFGSAAPAAAAATAHAASTSPPTAGIPLRPCGGGAAAAGFAPTPDVNRNVIVPCPACTFEQRFGNVKCELCNAVLVLRDR